MHFNTWHEKLSAVLKQTKKKANRIMLFFIFRDIYTNISTQASGKHNTAKYLEGVGIKERNIKLTKMINCPLIKSC